MKTIDFKFHELCDEIDYWKARAKKGVANALMLALSVRDDENGNLIISKEDRNELAKRYEDTCNTPGR